MLDLESGCRMVLVNLGLFVFVNENPAQLLEAASNDIEHAKMEQESEIRYSFKCRKVLHSIYRHLLEISMDLPLIRAKLTVRH